MLMLAIIGHTGTWADQLLPQLLMEQFDNFLGANSIRVISLCSSKWLFV